MEVWTRPGFHLEAPFPCMPALLSLTRCVRASRVVTRPKRRTPDSSNERSARHEIHPRPERCDLPDGVVARAGAVPRKRERLRDSRLSQLRRQHDDRPAHRGGAGRQIERRVASVE